MKIAVFFDLPPGGASRTLEEVLKILKRRHQITVFHDPKVFSLIASNRLLIDLESIFFQRLKQKYLAKKIDAQKYDLVFVSHDRHSQAPWVLRYLKTPTVFICQEPTRAYFEEFLRVDPKLPLLNKIYENINRKIRKQIEIKNASFATKIVANSVYSVESIFRAYGVLSTPVHLGIDPKEYFVEKVIKKNQVVVVGNNEPQKDLISAVNSVALVDKKIRPALVIASPRDSDMAEIKKLAKRKQVNLSLFIGLDQNKLRKIYNQSKLTLALAHLEPFGLSVIESMACGTPVIAVNEGGFKETITHDLTGLLLERNSSIIAEGINSLLRNKGKLSVMGKEGIKDAITRFTWEKTVGKLEKVFYEAKKAKNIRHHR